MKDRQNLLLRITCFFWIAIKLFSYKLWFAEGRTYPVVSPFEFLDTLPPAAHSVSFFLSLAGLALLIIFPRKKYIVIASLIVILFSCLLDVLRWQPWEYQFIFFLIIFIINRNNPAALYSAAIFVMASIYIYSGVHKFNGGFLYSVWERMILGKFFRLSPETIVVWKLHYAGLILPVIETVAGFALLVLKNKKNPAAILIMMHLLIIVILTDGGVDYNHIVLPWNMAMALILVFFYYKENFRFSMPLMLKGANLVIVLFWGILPALSIYGYWESKFSSNLYSGNTKFMSVCIQDSSEVQELEPYFRETDAHNLCKGRARLSLQHWSSEETHVHPYPEDWYFKKFKKKWEKMYPDVEAEFIIYRYPFKENVTLE